MPILIINQNFGKSFETWSSFRPFKANLIKGKLINEYVTDPLEMSLFNRRTLSDDNSPDLDGNKPIAI